MRWLTITLSLFACALFACDDGGADPTPDAGPADAAPGDAGGDAAIDMDAPDAMMEHPGLRNPALVVNDTAPDTFTVVFETTAGDFELDVTRAWSPLGVDRFHNLIKVGYYTDLAVFRVIDGFVAQTGISGDPSISGLWRAARIADDPVTQSNTRGTATFATGGADTRTTQIFFNFGDNSRLDDLGFSPFGIVRDMTALDAMYSGYGDGPPSGTGPDQGRIQSEGNAYLRAEYPELDYIVRTTLVE